MTVLLFDDKVLRQAKYTYLLPSDSLPTAFILQGAEWMMAEFNC
jgi:hypothetical protein